MDRQLFAIGQIVSIALHSRSGPQTEDHFRIVRRYPIKNRAPMYHVRSVVDRSERLVPESELSIGMPSIFGRPDGPSKILRLFPRIVPFRRAARP